MIRSLLALTLALPTTAVAGHPPHGELEEAVKRVATTREEYIRRLGDLRAAETRITRVRRFDGPVNRRRAVDSDSAAFKCFDVSTAIDIKT